MSLNNVSYCCFDLLDFDSKRSLSLGKVLENSLGGALAIGIYSAGAAVAAGYFVTSNMARVIAKATLG